LAKKTAKKAVFFGKFRFPETKIFKKQV